MSKKTNRRTADVGRVAPKPASTTSCVGVLPEAAISAGRLFDDLVEAPRWDGDALAPRALEDVPIARRSDPVMSHEAAREVTDSGRRLTQAEKILNRLMAGPATSGELAGLSIKYTGRVSDLRKLGYVIVTTRLDGGVYMYELAACP